MTPQPEFRTVYFDCPRIGERIRIDTKTVSLYGGITPMQMAAEVVLLRCSGMPTCRLFPLDKFPPKVSWPFDPGAKECPACGKS
jgi:hypothetical protein